MQRHTTSISHLGSKIRQGYLVGIRVGRQKPAHHQEHWSDNQGLCQMSHLICHSKSPSLQSIRQSHRPSLPTIGRDTFVWFLLRIWLHLGFIFPECCGLIPPRLWSGFLLVWLLYGASPSRFVWRVLRCPSKRGISSLCCSQTITRGSALALLVLFRFRWNNSH